MSTFKGFLAEFPLIRIDYYRTLPDQPPPLACFLSHVHSDHLQGLDSLKSPFVYCSSATRELLLRLEKYPHRMNFSKGILECRKQTYKHLKNLLKPLPLDTPTQIELSPGNKIQVTLLDANHCIGAVMFLIEGQGRAVLYTGDVRSEPWWISAVTRSPFVLPYTATGPKTLDNIYLDTTFASKQDIHCEFPPKADGLAELLTKLSNYTTDTIFYFHAWTFGYEDVWLLLSSFLNSPVHVDRYRHSIYTSLGGPAVPVACAARETPTLCGFNIGNTAQRGCLTRDTAVRIHSCEKSTRCGVIDAAIAQGKVVWITPIISRLNGVDVAELGAGGGRGDLEQTHELDVADPVTAAQLFALCSASVKDEALLQRIRTVLMQAVKERGALGFEFPEEHIHGSGSDDAVPLKAVVDIMSSLADGERDRVLDRHAEKLQTTTMAQKAMPRSITFPYSRHSSYTELRALVAAFRPRDIYPCTAAPPQFWNEERSMRVLFGDLCAAGVEGGPFTWDVEMEKCKNELEQEEMAKHDTSEGPRAGTKRARSEHARSQEERVEEGDLARQGSGRAGYYSTPKAAVGITLAERGQIKAAIPPVTQKDTPRAVNPSTSSKAAATTRRSTTRVPAGTATTPAAKTTGTLMERIRSSGDVAIDRLKRRAEAYEAAVQSEWGSRVQLTSVSSFPVEYEEEL